MMNNKSKIVLGATLFLLVTLLGYAYHLNTSEPIVITLDELQKINPSYTAILAQAQSSDHNFGVTFAIEQEGNRMVLGDLMVTNYENNSNTVIQKFNTSPFEFEKTLSFVSDHEVKFTETFVSGNYTFSLEKIIDLIDPKKNISLPALPNSKDDISEFWSAYHWVNDHTVQFQRHLSNSIGDEYPVETWQYDIGTRKYKLVQ